MACGVPTRLPGPTRACVGPLPRLELQGATRTGHIVAFVSVARTEGHMNDTNLLIVRILARIDAVFLPMRKWKRPLPGNTSAARANYRAGLGVLWVAGGSALERTRLSRVLADAKAAGLVTVLGSAARVSHVALSEGAEARARALVGLPSLQEAVACARQIAQDTAGATWPWLIETVPAFTSWGEAGASSRFMDLEDTLLPALVRGWVDSNSDSHGRVAYRLTDEGAAALAGRQSWPAAEVEYDGELAEAYYAALKSALSALAGKERNPGEIGRHPLGCSDMRYPN